MTQAIGKNTYTPQEYIDLELLSEERHEYADGEIRLMTGGTPNHNDIVSNLLIILKLALKGKPYRTFISDQRLWISDRHLYTYPDIMVLPNPIQLQEKRTNTVMNPCFIAEVLSKSTRDYDRGEKFLAYRSIATFQEYLLVDQYKIYVEHYFKTSANQWLLTEYSDPQATLSLNSVKIDIQIADLYEGIDFT